MHLFWQNHGIVSPSALVTHFLKVTNICGENQIYSTVPTYMENTNAVAIFIMELALK
jgi:hypothetical protein